MRFFLPYPDYGDAMIAEIQSSETVTAEQRVTYVQDRVRDSSQDTKAYERQYSQKYLDIVPADEILAWFDDDYEEVYCYYMLWRDAEIQSLDDIEPVR